MQTFCAAYVNRTVIESTASLISWLTRSDCKKLADFQVCQQQSNIFVVLLRLSKPVPKPQFFCQTEPNRNRGFMPLYWRFGFEMEQLWCLER